MYLTTARDNKAIPCIVADVAINFSHFRVPDGEFSYVQKRSHVC